MSDLDKKLRSAPSKEAVVKWLNKEPNANQALIKSFIERCFLIGGGIFILGKKDNIIRNSIAASTAIELYLLWYYNKQLKQINKDNAQKKTQ
mgnify:CR=1 FL=1